VQLTGWLWGYTVVVLYTPLTQRSAWRWP